MGSKSKSISAKRVALSGLEQPPPSCSAVIKASKAFPKSKAFGSKDPEFERETFSIAASKKRRKASVDQSAGTNPLWDKIEKDTD